MSLRDANQSPDESRINGGHIDIHHWVRKVNLQLISTVSVDRPAASGKVISIGGRLLTMRCRRFGTGRTPADETVFDDDKTDDAMGFLAEFCRQYQLDNVEFSSTTPIA
jgi:hypothetical protein